MKILVLTTRHLFKTVLTDQTHFYKFIFVMSSPERISLQRKEHDFDANGKARLAPVPRTKSLIVESHQRLMTSYPFQLISRASQIKQQLTLTPGQLWSVVQQRSFQPQELTNKMFLMLCIQTLISCGLSQRVDGLRSSQNQMTKMIMERRSLPRFANHPDHLILR